MKRRGAGHIIFIGATASRRGGAKTAAFASAKAAQRSLAESLARSLGPAGIHVSLIIIDGIVDEPSIRTKLADKLDSFFVKLDDIADTALMLTRLATLSTDRAADRREKARLRSERARRARGVPPRPKAQQPWLAAGMSRSTWYRRQKKTSQQAAAALAASMRQAALDRLEWQITQLLADLQKAAAFVDIGAAVLDELAGVSFRNGL
jgi:short chain dehydrogenase